MYDDLQHDDTENVNDNYLLKLYWNLIHRCILCIATY